MRILIGSDHAGLSLKGAVKEHLEGLGHEVEDVGAHDRASVDYPDTAHTLCEGIGAGRAPLGILVCGTGHGMAIAANKHSGIRAGCPFDTFSARMLRAHNDANVLCLGQRTVGEGLALELVDTWLGATFEGGRHGRRVGKIEAC